MISSSLPITLLASMDDIGEAIFPLHRAIETCYQKLPWPSKIKNIVVLTEVPAGRGDVAAAAKAISVMHQFCDNCHFDWVLTGNGFRNNDPSFYLPESIRNKVHIRSSMENSSVDQPADFILAGPVPLTWDKSYIEKRISRKIAGPVFGFCEIADTGFLPDSEVLGLKIQKDKPLHAFFFPSQKAGKGLLPMGLKPGTGVFLDQSRIEALLSKGDHCPSYIAQIQDVELRKDLSFDDDLDSFNSGYAHHPASWGKFIDVVAKHEKNKNVVIVLNQSNAAVDFSSEEFATKILSDQRLKELAKKGFGTIRLKARGEKMKILRMGKNLRALTVIIRPFFLPEEMRCLQFASERLLTTGDNTPIEGCCARCKLLVYEDVSMLGEKWRFLIQMVDLANTIDPNLSQLLALFGGDKRLPNRLLNQELDFETKKKIERLLDDPNLDSATMQFCKKIAAEYSFEPVLMGALKRAAWHHVIPSLANIEEEALQENFHKPLVAHLKNPVPNKTNLLIDSLPQISRRVNQAVHKYFWASNHLERLQSAESGV